MRSSLLWLASLASIQGSVVAWTSSPRVLLSSTTLSCSKSRKALSPRNGALGMIMKEKRKEETDALTPDETTKKYGLEAGLFQSMQQQNSVGGENGESSATSAGALLKKYGVAYLATSIPLALISFSICYLLVDNGVDVASILQKIPGLASVDVGENGERVGTAAIAYAAHKAASPIRFPPTVLLTPVVAKFIGKEPNTDEDTE